MSVDRSELVKHQLRDKHGRWIKMGFKVKWGGDSGDSFHGTVVGIHDGTATVRLYDKYGQDLHKNATVSGDKLEVINAKAILHLDANGHAIADPHPAHVPEVAPSEHKIGSTLPDKYKITGGHLYTKVNDLKVGQQVYPISHAGSEKSIYNTKQSYSDIGVLKNAPGLGTVSKIKPNAYAEITPAGGGDPIYISKNHYVSVRTPELDDAILHAQKVEAQSIYHGKEAPKLPWIDKLKDAQVPAHDGTHVNGTTPGTAVEHTPAEPATPSVSAVQENPFGSGYKALGFVPAQMKKGDKALLNDGKTGDYVGKGQYTVGEHTLTGLKFNIDGKNVVVPGKDIKDIYRPDSHIVATKTSGSPFGTEYKPVSFDMGKTNTENFKPGDKITYGDGNHPATIVQIHEHDIIVNKDDSQTHNYTPWIHLKPSQVKGLYRKEAAAEPSVSPIAEHYTDDKIGMHIDHIINGKKSHTEPSTAKPFAPAPTQEHAPADENLKSMMDQINGTESKPSSSAAVAVYPDKGKSVTNESGQVFKVNSEVFTPKFGKGIVAIVLPSSDPSKLGSAKVNYHEHGYKVTQAKNLSLVTEDLKQAEPVSTDHLKPGDTGLNPANGKNFIAGKDSQPIHVGDKVSYTKGSKTNTGTVKGIYAGEKTVSIKWDDGTVSGPKKASTLTAVNKPDANHTDAPSESEAPAETPVEQMPEKYSKEDEEALLAFSTNAKEIGEHLRGIAAHAFPNAEGIIYGLDNLLKNSSLSQPTTVYRGFKINSANHGNGKSVFDSVKVGSIWRDKSFTSTSLSADIANQSLNEMEGDHSVLLTFELPAGYHATQINYNGFSDKSMAAKAHEQEVILPRAMEYEISHVEDTVDANGNPIRKATLKGVIKDTADGLTSPGVHQVTSDEKVSEHPYQMLKDPGADGDGFHPSGPWGHFGASGVMVQAIDPNTHEPVYLIVENGALHEEQNQGLWQLPGGALNGNENPYEGAAREMWEELDVPPDTMAALSHVGNIQYSNGKGWAYNNLAAKHNGAPFDVKIDVIETSDHKWATKEELLQMKADGKLLPAFAQNIENVLNLYPEEPKQESGHLSLNDFTKVQGKGQQGSNSGGFYTNKATGEEYYIKSGMSEDHAHNEILASKIYQAMGINASNQEPIDLGHGKLGIASKIIATDGHSSNQNLHNPEYLKKVQEGFAVDALLANWDVAGMGYDNILTDAHGNPLRIDPGASLKYRAQGALKSDFGKSVGEWKYLRDGSNNESSGLKYNKTLFGSMSNQQLIDSAAQLNSLTDDKIDSIVDSVGFDKKNADYFKETLKARRDDILHRASLLDNPTKDDNGQQTEQQPASTGNPETGSQPGGQVHVDSGSGGDNGASGATGEVAPAVAVGDKVAPDKIDSLPVGAEIALGDSSSSVKVRKTGPGNWVIAGGINNGHALKSSSIQSHLDGQSATVTYLLEDTAAPTEEPAGQQGYDVYSHQVSNLPVGSEIKLNVGSGTGNGSHFKKVSDDSWEIVGIGTSNGVKLPDVAIENAMSLNGAKLTKTGTPAVQTPAVDTSQVKEGDKLTLNDLKNIPDGTKLKTGNGFILEKESPTTWLFNGDGGFSLSGVSSAFGDKQMEVVHAPAGLTKESSAPTVEAPAAPTTPAAPAVADTSGALKVGDTIKSDHLSDLPVGTRINVGGIGVEKTNPSHWHMLNPDGSLDQHSTAYQESMLKSSWAPIEIKVTYLPQVSTPQSKYNHGDVVDHADLSSMPAGSVITFKKGGSQFTKTPAGKWESSMGGGATYTSSYMGSLYTEGELSYVSGPAWDGKLNPNPLPDYTAGDSIGAQDIFQLPIGSKISYATEHYTKVDNYEWKSEATGKLYEDLDLVESLEGLDITYNGGGQTPTPKTTVPGKNGEALGQGDTIIWATKGIKGQVVDVNTVDSKVQMLLPDGTKKWYSSSKMVKAYAPAASQAAPAPKAPTTDPSSPLYGAPEPVYVAPEKPADLPQTASYLPDGFIEEIEKRYADKVNPSWSKAKPQDSYYWSKVEDFQNTGSLNSLDMLHQKLYISDEMFKKAKDHLDAIDAPMKAYEAELNKSKIDFQKNLTEWKKVNGHYTASIEDHFPATSTSEWTKETGFVTNADGSVSADWTKAPVGSHSVSSILNSMSTDEILSAHGISAMVDSSFIKDNNVRFTKVVDENGNVQVQARFEVSEFNKNDVISAMNNGGSSSYGVKAGFLGYIQQKIARFNIFSPTGEKLDLQSGDTYQKTVGNSKLMFQSAEGHGWTNNRGALNAMAYITMPENATASDFENALKGMGITDAHPSPKESVDFSKKKLIVSTYKGFIGEGNTKYEENPALLDTHVNATLASLGGAYTIDDFKLVHTQLGFYQFRVPNVLRDKLTAESGMKGLFHGNKDWVPDTENTAKFKKHEWNASMGLERQLSKFTGASKGFLATARRMLEGDNSKGMSPGPDITSGGARYLFTTPFKSNNWASNIGYDTGVAMHPSIAFQYLGAYANSEDNGSGKRKEGEKVAEVLGGYYGGSPELMIPNGVSVNDTWFAVTNSQQKPFLVQSMLDRGISDINGIPVEQYFVIPGVDPIPAYVEQNPQAGM